MTRAACNLIIHLATIRHTWRSLQSLKHIPHYSREEATCKEDDYCDQSDTRTAIMKQHSTLLQLWSLFALNRIFILSGLEAFLSLLPFYFYIKLILILITVNTDTGFANYWFETILVPLMDHIHALTFVDFRQEIILFPYTLLHTIVFPGIFSPEPALKIDHAIQTTSTDKTIEGLQDVSLNIFNSPMDTVDTDSSLSVTQTNHSMPRRSPLGKLGEKIREMVVGDENIRLRDYLFNIDLPSPHSPQSTWKQNEKVRPYHGTSTLNETGPMKTSPFFRRLNSNMTRGQSLKEDSSKPRVREQSTGNISPWIRRSQRLVNMNGTRKV